MQRYRRSVDDGNQQERAASAERREAAVKAHRRAPHDDLTDNKFQFHSCLITHKGRCTAGPATIQDITRELHYHIESIGSFCASQSEVTGMSSS